MGSFSWGDLPGAGTRQLVNPSIFSQTREKTFATSVDSWSDPKGEFLAEKAAGAVYMLLDKQGLETNDWPPAGVAILHTLGYYMHAGGHGTLPQDWAQFLKFLQIQLGDANTSTRSRATS
jgi:hypothetical protein